MSYEVTESMRKQYISVPTSGRPLDYYSVLTAAISHSERDSAQLRAMVYELARFNLKREALFRYPPMSMPELTRHMNELELAIAHIEANSADERASLVPQDSMLEHSSSSTRNPLIIMPARPIPPLFAGPAPFRAIESQHPQFDPLRPYLRALIQLVGVAAIGVVFISAAVVASVVASIHYGRTLTLSPATEVVQIRPGGLPLRSGSTEADSAALVGQSADLPSPLPTTYGIYALSDNKLTELEALPFKVPDPRVMLGPEITKPSLSTISSNKPVFILFRRDLANSDPGKITLRVIARVTREMKFVNGKASVSKVEGAWHIRNNSIELKASPIVTNREMIIARGDEGFSLLPGRYALVLNGLGYDFTVAGPVTSPVQCLERVEAANGPIFTECRAP